MRPIRRAIALSAVVAISLGWAQNTYEQIDGRGDDVVDLVDLREGLLMIAAAHQGDSNFVLQLYDETGARARGGLIVNTIGAYAGGRILPVGAGSHTLQVRASGQWRVRYQQPSTTAAGTPPPVEHTATGDLPLGPIELSAGLLRASFTHRGAGNFAVILYHGGGQRVGLLVNEIGDYSSTTAQQIRMAGPHYFDIQADGEWSISIL